MTPYVGCEKADPPVQYLSMRTLPFLLAAGACTGFFACTESVPSDAEGGGGADGGAGGDADGDGDGDELTEIPDVISRAEPECVLFDDEADDTNKFASDYFTVCDNGLTLGDSAYTYVAEEEGMFVFSLYRDDGAMGFLELRKGECPSTPEASAGDEPVCAGFVSDEEGSHLEASAYLQDGESVTVIIEGDAYYEFEQEIRKASPGLGVKQECTGEETTNGETITEISGPLPAEVGLRSRAGHGSFVKLSCSEGNFGEPDQGDLAQLSVSWTAPEDGTFLLSAATESSYSDAAISLAVLQENCGGEELACAHADSGSDQELATEVLLTAEKDQIFALVVELQNKGFEDEDVFLRVEKL